MVLTSLATVVESGSLVYILWFYFEVFHEELVNILIKCGYYIFCKEVVVSVKVFILVVTIIT